MRRLLLAVLVAGCASSLPFAPPVARPLHAGLRPAQASGSASAVEDAFLAGVPAVTPGVGSAPPKLLEATTKNGVRILGCERRELPIVSFGIVLKNAMPAGAAAGYRSLLLGTLRRGTKDVERSAIYDRFSQLAIEWDSSSIADRGVYFELKAVRPLALTGLRRALDMFGDPGLRKEDFDDAKDSVTASASNGDRSPMTIATDLALDRLYPKSASFRSIDADALKKLTLGELTAFAQGALTADNVVVTAAGDFDWQGLVATVENELGKLPRGTLAWPVPDHTPPAGALLVAHPAAQAQLVVAFRGPPTGHPDRAAMLLADAALSSRLFRSLRLTHGITYGSSVRLYPGRESPPILISTAVEPGGVLKAMDGVFDAITKVETLSEEEVASSRALAQAQVQDGLSTVSGAVGTLAGFGANDLPLNWYDGRWKELGAVTAADVARVVKTYLERGGMQLVVVGDVKGMAKELEARGLGPVEVR